MLCTNDLLRKKIEREMYQLGLLVLYSACWVILSTMLLHEAHMPLLECSHGTHSQGACAFLPLRYSRSVLQKPFPVPACMLACFVEPVTTRPLFGERMITTWRSDGDGGDGDGEMVKAVVMAILWYSNDLHTSCLQRPHRASQYPVNCKLQGEAEAKRKSMA